MKWIVLEGNRIWVGSSQCRDCIYSMEIGEFLRHWEILGNAGECTKVLKVLRHIEKELLQMLWVTQNLNKQSIIKKTNVDCNHSLYNEKFHKSQ